jgi:hypothetical protein
VTVKAALQPSLPRGSRFRWDRLLLSLLFAAVALFFFVYFSNVNDNPRATLPAMVYGTAHRPFVYRVLVPGIIRIATAVTPEQARMWLVHEADSTPFIREALLAFHTEPAYFVEALFALLLMYLSLVGFIYAFRYLLTGVFRAPAGLADLLPPLATLGLIPCFFYGYIYDFTTLFLSTLGLGLLVRAHWRAFLLIFLLACVNKETAILLTVIYAVQLWRSPRLSRALYWGLLAAQAAIYAILRAIVTWAFRDNAGSLVEFNLVKHLVAYVRVPLVAVLSALVIALILFLMFYRWREKPRFLLRSTLIIVPLFGLYLFFGWAYEFRTFYEIYASILLLCAHSVCSLFGVKIMSSA